MNCWALESDRLIAHELATSGLGTYLYHFILTRLLRVVIDEAIPHQAASRNPPADLLEHPLGGIQLRTVWRLDDGCQSNTPYHLAPVTTRSIPHQRLHVRVMLQAIDCRRYSRRPHRVDPTPQQPAPPNVYHQEQVRPLVDHLHSLMHLHSTTPPHPADHPPQPHSHLIGKAKGRIRTHARSGKGATEAPFFHDSCAPTSAFS